MVYERVLITPKILNDFKILREKDTSFRKIAKMYGISHHTVIDYVKGYKPKLKFWTEKDIKIIKKEYPQGNLNKLQKKFKCSLKAIKHQAGKYNIQRNILGKNNPNWKGNNVGYIPLHQWIRVRKPKPKFCEMCKMKPPYDLANISGKYKRDVNDFRWMCRSCHMKSDGRMNNLKQFQKK